MPRTREQLDAVREKSRTLVVDTALKLFAENGFHTTSMQTIAKEAGIAVGVVYIYFKGKDELLDEIIRRALTRSASLLMQMDIREHQDAGSFLVTISTLFDGVRANLQTWRLIMRIALEPGLDGFGKGHFSDFSQHMSGICQHYYEGKGVEDPSKKGAVLGLMLHGALLTFILSGDETGLTLYLDEIRRYL